MTGTPPLPDWSVEQWFNTDTPISLTDLRGKIVVIEAFQMLCPGCVTHGLPLARQLLQGLLILSDLTPHTVGLPLQQLHLTHSLKML